jgi:hypothetical protein
MFSKIQTQFDAPSERIVHCRILNTAPIDNLFDIPSRDVSKSGQAHSAGHRHCELSNTALAQLFSSASSDELLHSISTLSLKYLMPYVSLLQMPFCIYPNWLTFIWTYYLPQLLPTELPFLLPSIVNYSTENLYRLASPLADDLSFTVSLSGNAPIATTTICTIAEISAVLLNFSASSSGSSSKSSLPSITCSGCRPYWLPTPFTSTTLSCIIQPLPIAANVVPSFGNDSRLL